MENRKRTIARLLLEAGAITLRPEKPFTWASGIQSPIYCDNRVLISSPEKRRLICDGFVSLLQSLEPDAALIAGVATGAIPHAAWLADRRQLPMVYIRGEAKGHGKENRVEGKVAPGVLGVMIEDLVSTGGSSVAAVETLRNAGANVNHCLAIFSYGFAEAEKKFADIGCQLTTLTDFPTLVQVATESNLIHPDQVALLLEFSRNPGKWKTE